MNIKYFGLPIDLDFYKLMDSFTYDFSNLAQQIQFHIFNVDFGYSFLDSEVEMPNCLSKGKYCAEPSPALGIEDGRLIVMEGIRQKCILKTTHDDNEHSKFLTYLRKFRALCIDEGGKSEFTKECAETAAGNSNIDVISLNKCIDNTFDGKINSEKDYFSLDNKMLKRDRDRVARSNVFFFPAITINDVEFRGNWTEENLLEVVCVTLIDKPSYCEEITTVTVKEDSFNWTALMTIIAVVAVNIVIAYVCIRRIRARVLEKVDSDDFHSKVNHIMTSYKKLSG